MALDVCLSQLNQPLGVNIEISTFELVIVAVFVANEEKWGTIYLTYLNDL